MSLSTIKQIPVYLQDTSLHFSVPVTKVSFNQLYNDPTMFVPGGCTWTTIGWMQCQEIRLDQDGSPQKIICRAGANPFREHSFS